MSLFSWRLAVLCLFALCTVGCASSPLAKLDVIGGSGDSILITGHATLGGKQVRLTDPEEIRQVTRLIGKVRRFRVIQKRSRWSFISTPPSIGFRIESKGKSSTVSMISGMMTMPGDSIVFYGDETETQAELWSLAMKHLGVDENETPVQKTIGEAATP